MTAVQEIIQWTIENAFNVTAEDGTKYIAIDHEEMRENFDKWLEKEKKQFDLSLLKKAYDLIPDGTSHPDLCLIKNAIF
jgi:hypothetical protein